MNACCTILESNMYSLGKVDNLSMLLGNIVKEFAAAAALEGVSLDVEQMTDMVCYFTTDAFAGVHHHPSMYQDLIKNNRLTEIDYLNGYVVEKLQACGTKAKYCELITLLIHAKEKIMNAQ